MDRIKPLLLLILGVVLLQGIGIITLEIRVLRIVRIVSELSSAIHKEQDILSELLRWLSLILN